jgi:two-component system sensor histidine kinase YesM
VSGALYIIFNRNFEQLTQENKQQTLEQLVYNTSNYFDELNRLTLTMISNGYLLELLSAPLPQNELEMLEKRRAIEAFLDDIMITPREDILSVYLLADEIYRGGRYSASVDTTINYKEFAWYQEAITSGQPVFVPAHTEVLISDAEYTVFSFVRTLIDPSTMETIAVIKVDANTRALESLFEQIDTGLSGFIVMEDANETIFLSTATQDIDTKTFLDAPIDDDGYRVAVNGKKYILNKAENNRYGLTLWSFSSIEDLEHMEAQQLRLTLIAAIGFSIMTLIILLIFTSNLLRPLLHIVSLMKQAENGNMAVAYTLKRKDEIGYLGTSFNHMLTRINQTTQENTRLITEMYEAKELQNRAQLHALQAQIKPHFMCNTLNMISILMQSGEKVVAVDTINRLSHLMRGITDFRTSVPLKQELDLLRSYLDIQQTRYADRLIYEETVAQELYCYRLPALLLQPIVENVIIHGCENKEGVTYIHIYNETDSAFLRLIVKDNAYGIEPALLSSLKEKLNNAKEVLPSNISSHGVGLVNIHSRIQLCYGKQYGLSIESIPGVSTTVTLRLPLPQDNRYGKEDIV